MKRLATIVLLLITTALTLSGCFLMSVHPLVERGDGDNVEDLQGVWEGEDGSIWYFINDANNYRLFMESDDKPYTEGSPFNRWLDGHYDVYYEADTELLNLDGSTFMELRDTTNFWGVTVELNGDYYLDLFTYPQTNDIIRNHLFPVHTFYKISFEENQMIVEPFDNEWFRDQALNNRIRLNHALVREAYILLTASTEELQEFVIKYGNEENAYEEPIILNRIQ